MKAMLVVPALLALQLVATAQDKNPTWVETRFHRVHLRNGNFIDGQLVRQNSKIVVLNLKSGEFGVGRDMVQRVEFITMRLLSEPAIVMAPQPAAVAAAENKPEADGAKPPAPESKDIPARFTAETRKAVERVLLGFSTANVDLRGSLGPKIQELGAEAVAYACWLARHGNPIVDRQVLVAAIAQCTAPEVHPALLDICASCPDSFARAAAVRALAKEGTPDGLAAVHKAVIDPSGQVWRVAAEELLELSKTGGANVETIISLMKDKEEKGVIAQLLGKIGGDAALTALHGLLKDGSSRDKVVALASLAGFPRPEDGELALELIDHADDAVSKAAVQYVGRAKYGPAVRALIDAMAGDEKEIAELAQRSLLQITGQGFAGDRALWETWWEREGKAKFPEPQ
jgi:HEAT repeat protein